jgi:MerR family transcriptional regulator/heat shock protein HspR
MISNSLDPVISIGTLAKKVGLSVSAIRKYEEEGILISHRVVSGHRLFSYEDITRLQNIQKLIREHGLNIEGIRRMQAILPCWNILPCNSEIRDKCLAFKGSTKPCWMIKDAHCTLQGNECRKCVVYRFGSLYTDNIKDLIHAVNNNSEQRNKIAELLNEI